jgi:hypothetical protein
MLLLPLLLLLFLLLPWRRRRAARKGADPETSLFQRKRFPCPRVGVGMRVGLGNTNLQPPTLNRACACTCGHNRQKRRAALLRTRHRPNASNSLQLHAIPMQQKIAQACVRVQQKQ